MLITKFDVMKQLLVFISLIILSGCKSRTNYSEVVNRLEKQHQECLDKGEDMLGCSRIFYSQMDSMLNVVYEDLMGRLDKIEKNSLREEEKQWIKQRDIEFRKITRELRESIDQVGFVPQDNNMMAYDEQADLVKKRIRQLIDKLEKKQ